MPAAAVGRWRSSLREHGGSCPQGYREEPSPQRGTTANERMLSALMPARLMAHAAEKTCRRGWRTAAAHFFARYNGREAAGKPRLSAGTTGRMPQEGKPQAAQKPPGRFGAMPPGSAGITPAWMAAPRGRNIMARPPSVGVQMKQAATPARRETSGRRFHRGRSRPPPPRK